MPRIIDVADMPIIGYSQTLMAIALKVTADSLSLERRPSRFLHPAAVLIPQCLQSVYLIGSQARIRLASMEMGSLADANLAANLCRRRRCRRPASE